MSEDPTDSFIARLEILAGVCADSVPDRSALAALRRILATWPSVPAKAMRVIAPFLPHHATGWRETVYYLAAGLFAMHPCSSGSAGKSARSFGATLRQAASSDPAQGPERRLLALLGCRSEDLPDHLRHAVSYLRARDVPVDYRQLMKDLFWWDAGEGKVQRRWGRDFWSGTSEQNQPKPGETKLEETSDVH
jgi:CRISPR system Cascade subunit CasB